MGGPGSGRKPYGTKAVCGTRAKYQYHRKRKEHCEMCLNAEREYARRRNPPKHIFPRNKVKATKQLVKDFKLAAGNCLHCGWEVTIERLAAFDCDHRDPDLKELEISEASKDVSVESMRRELLKCDVLCANCHRLKTQKWNKENRDRKRQVIESNQLTLDLSNI